MILKSLRRPAPRALLLALTVSLLAACASTGTSETPAEPGESEAALLDNAEAATPVSDPSSSSVFADLQPASAVMDNLQASGDGLNTAPVDETKVDASAASEAPAADASAEKTAEAPAASTDSSDPFYNPIGGESLGRVAYVLYGDRKAAKSLREQNPSLADVKKLTTDQKVYFHFDEVHPNARLLSKDLIDRYPAQLAERLASSTEQQAKTKVTLGKGETLQALSQRLYGTTRYWTEIYLLNQSSIPNYDKVKAGTELSVIERQPVAPVAQKEEAPAPVAKPHEAVPAPTPMEAKRPEAPKALVMPEAAQVAPMPMPEKSPAPVAEKAPEPAPMMDPIPETPPAQSVSTPAPTPAPMPSMPAASESSWKGPSFSVSDFFANSANVRRAVYVVAILLIGAAGFFLTRTKKKNFDMLDLTTSTMAPRPKLDKDNKRDIG